MLKLTNLTFTYKHNDEPALKNLNFEIRPGELVLLQGSTGSGKSTLLKTINGLAPHFTGGKLSGSVQINGVDTTRRQPHEIAELVAFVNQQPESAFATDTVEEELAFGLEQLGWPVAAIAERLAELTHQFAFDAILTKPLTELSGGQQQRVAIASAIAARQKLLLMDEPTSALDSQASASLIETLRRIAKDEGISVLVAEHRVERLLPFVDRSVLLDDYGSLSSQTPSSAEPSPSRPKVGSSIQGSVVLECLNLNDAPGPGFTLENIDVCLRGGEILGVLGENGSGKSTLLNAVFDDARRQGVAAAMVPQNAADLLFLSSVSDELAEADAAAGQPKAGAQLERLVGRIDPNKHPRDLSSGQQLALVLAIQLSKDARVLILDEPTRGLDSKSKERLKLALAELRDLGHAILIATHDEAFLSDLAAVVLEIDNGRIAGDSL
jgi:energy-coupling factor transport system ATP-binding protein